MERQSSLFPSSIWPNNKTLDFSSSPITLPQPTPSITIADVDGDGHPDIVSACTYGSCQGQVLYGNGSYQFTPVAVTNLSWPYVVGKFTGGGKVDLATGSGTFLNMGARTFQEVIGNNLPLGNGTLAVVADFNGDGKDSISVRRDPSRDQTLGAFEKGGLRCPS
jgi:hypothetical protein